MPSLIYGFGVTGKSFQRYLDNKGEEFEIYDTLNSNSLKIASKIEDGFYTNIYVSPSVPKEKFRNLKKYSTVITDMDIFFNEDDSVKIGITGTNKKSTTNGVNCRNHPRAHRTDLVAAARARASWPTFR